MRILYVVSRPLEINTSASIRNKATIEGLIELGHQVDLVTTQYDTNHSNFDKDILNENLNVEYLKLGGIQGFAKVGRKYKYLRPIKNMLYNFMSKFEIYDNLKGIVEHSTRIEINDEKYDLIISSSDPKSSHLFIHRIFEIGLIRDTPWIQIWGDPFLSDITRKNNILSIKIKKEETKLLKYANKVIYVSNLTLNEQQKIYKEFAYKMFYEPIPYVKEELYPITLKQNKSLTFLYCGDYSSNIRTIKPLYDAINNTSHKLIICGNTDLKLKSTDRIKIYPRVSYEKTKEFESKCDVLVHLSNNRGTQIPGKLYQYSGTNKLILFILDGNTQLIKESFSKYHRYVFSENKVENIESTIFDIAQDIYSETQFVVKDFSPKIIANRIINITKDV